ncbi:hypothetical protein AURDEDRAFT_184017 [Auricularia subglabra TFB-10046 SS5]|nr:hypothetical protein AURDEDRAFT_184017 [Auricularia subglabra TFB-10046 SS5]
MAMALGKYPELQPGNEILASPFTDAAPSLTIRVTSHEMARGGTAVILKGDVVSSGPDDYRLAVALKVVMDVPKGESNYYHERMRREIAAVQQIQHRFILPFLGVVLGGTYTILVSQFMENGDLLQYLKSQPSANRRQLQAFTGAVAWPELPLHTVFHKVWKNVTPERRDEAIALGLDDKLWSMCIACWRSKPRERPTMEEIILELNETSDRPSPSRNRVIPWSLPSIFTSLRRARPPYQSVTPRNWGVTFDLVSEPVRSPSLPPASPKPSAAQDDGDKCRHCHQHIVGVRYQCAICESDQDSYNLCSTCETISYIVHDDAHIFFKLPRPVKQRITSPSPLLPHLYLKPAGFFPDGTRDQKNPERYLTTVQHESVLCDGCLERIEGKWYRCVYCGMDFCNDCEAIDTHNDSHFFVVFKAVLDLTLFRDFADVMNPAPLIHYSVY